MIGILIKYENQKRVYRICPLLEQRINEQRIAKALSAPVTVLAGAQVALLLYYAIIKVPTRWMSGFNRRPPLPVVHVGGQGQGQCMFELPYNLQPFVLAQFGQR